MLRIQTHLKVEPITVAVGISIRSKIQFILIFGNSHCSVQVSTLKVGIKPDWTWLFLCISDLLKLLIVTLRSNISILWILKRIKILFPKILMHLQRVSRPETSVNDSFFCIWCCRQRRTSILNRSVALLHGWEMSWHCRSRIILLLLNRLCHLLLLHILKLSIKLVLFISKSYYRRYLI